MLLIFHFALTRHVITSRDTWYADSIATDPEAGKDRVCAGGQDFFPCGTQLLSLATVSRALAGLIVINSGDTELTNRISPLFLDLIICIILLCTLRILLFTDFVLLVLMKESNTLMHFRKQITVDDNLTMLMGEMSALNRVFATARPSY